MSEDEKWSGRRRLGGRCRGGVVAMAATVLVASVAARDPLPRRGEAPAGRPGAEADQPVGRFERDAVDTLPGVVPRRPTSPGIDAMVHELADERQRGDAGVRSEELPVRFGDLVDDPWAPPRMDVGDANPDRHGVGPHMRRTDGGRGRNP